MASVIIIGGGMVGLSLALRLAQAQIPVSLIEAKPSFLTQRVSALNLASERWLQKISIWNLLSPNDYGLMKRMLVWDGLGGGVIEFADYEVNEAHLGSIIENRIILENLWNAAKSDPLISVHCPATPEKITVHGDHVELILNTGESLEAALCVGADGASSWLSSQFDIKIFKRDYRQQAITALVECEESHNNTAYQVFLSSGPLALLPLVNAHQCALIWSIEANQVNDFMDLSLAEFSLELSRLFGSTLGEKKIVSERQVFPLVMRHASNYIASRAVLVGDAAHTIHPLAGQGVNLGFADANCLAELLIDAYKQGRDLGESRILRRYERERRNANDLMLKTVRAFREEFSSCSPIQVALRSLGMNFANRCQLLKQFLTKTALGL